MTLVKICLSIVAVAIILIAAIMVGVVKIFPKYAHGEALAIVNERYPGYQPVKDPEYLLEGRWLVTAQDDSGNIWELTVYEQTSTIQAKEVMVQAPAPGATPLGAVPWVWVGNLALLAGNIIFALVNWFSRRRNRVDRLAKERL